MSQTVSSRIARKGSSGYVPLSTLKEEAREAGLVLERKAGPAMAYLARFRPSAATL